MKMIEELPIEQLVVSVLFLASSPMLGGRASLPAVSEPSLSCAAGDKHRASEDARGGLLEARHDGCQQHHR